MNTEESKRKGWLRTKWERAFGSEDDVDREVRELKNQGAFMARVARFAGSWMIVLVSTATIITLGLDSLDTFVASWDAHHPDVVVGISLATLFMLVFCMDIGMVYGVTKIRLLTARKASVSEMVIDWAIVGLCASVESLTYYLMLMKYDPPSTNLALALVYARAFLAPLLAIYLSSAQSLGILARDILNIANRRAGLELLRRIGAFGKGVEASIGQVFAVFHATAHMTDRDKDMMQSTYRAVAQWNEPALAAPVVEADPIVASVFSPVQPTAVAPAVQVVSAMQRDQYITLIEAQMRDDPKASPSVIAANLGLTTKQVCAYMASRIGGRVVANL